MNKMYVLENMSVEYGRLKKKINTKTKMVHYQKIQCAVESD